MDNQLLQNLKDSIEKSEQIAVAVGRNPTVDQMAAALSLSLTLSQNNKRVVVVSASEPTVEVSSLVGIDTVKTQYGSDTGDLVVSFPYNEGEIEKVSYTMDDNFLNIVVKAGENGLNFNEQDVKYTRGGGTPNLLFVIGTPFMEEISSIFTPELLSDSTVVNIDNNDTNERFGDIALVSSKFSSLSEQVADLLLSLGYEMDIDVAQNLMVGITEGTNNFQSQNTSYLAFEIAAILMKRGAVRQQIATRPADDFGIQSYGGILPTNTLSQNRPQNEQNRSQRPMQTQPRNQNQNRPQPQPQQVMSQPEPEEVASPMNQEDQTPPADWLTPKVYKGSTNI